MKKDYTVKLCVEVGVEEVKDPEEAGEKAIELFYDSPDFYEVKVERIRRK